MASAENFAAVTKRKTPVRLCIIINPSIAMQNFYRDQFPYLMRHGCRVTVITGPGPEHEIIRAMGVTTHVVPMKRRPSPGRDLVSLGRLWWYLLWHRFDVIHVASPKGGLLGAIAARLSGHRRLVYTLLGRAYEHMSGLRRKMMNGCERLVCGLARRVTSVSHELADMVVAEGLCSGQKMLVIGSGSVNGVELDRFERTEERKRAGRQIRRRLGIPTDAVVILSVAWVRKDKGTNELVRAFDALAAQRKNAHLVMLGKRWEADPLEPDVDALIGSHPRIHHLVSRPDVVPFYMAAEIMVLPSWREGLPNVVLEASAALLPIIATDIPGCREAVLKDKTGLLVPLRDVQALSQAMLRLVDDPQLRDQLGRNGHRRIEKEFRQEIIWDGLLELYGQLMRD